MTPLMGLVLGLLTSCVDEEGVLLSAELTSPATTVASSTLVTEVTGDFEIHLSLGERASDSTTVELGTFSLQRDGDVLLSPLELDTDPEFPVTVAVGGTKRVAVTIGPQEADAEIAESLCSGELWIVGTLTDSLGDDRPVTVSSGSFSPACE
jgi:hypothetical protein